MTDDGPRVSTNRGRRMSIIMFTAADVDPRSSGSGERPAVVFEDRVNVQVQIVVIHTTPFARKNSMNVASGIVT